jgi:hypothetical protein
MKVDTLKFSIRDSKHDFLYKTLRPLATGLVKKQIEKAMRSSITTGMEYVDGQLVGVRDRMASAKVTEGESRSKVLQDVRAPIRHLPRPLLTFPTLDVHEEEGRDVRAFYDLQRAELAVQGCAQQTEFDLGHWASR